MRVKVVLKRQSENMISLLASINVSTVILLPEKATSMLWRLLFLCQTNLNYTEPLVLQERGCLSIHWCYKKCKKGNAKIDSKIREAAFNLPPALFTAGHTCRNRNNPNPKPSNVNKVLIQISDICIGGFCNICWVAKVVKGILCPHKR